MIGRTSIRMLLLASLLLAASARAQERGLKLAVGDVGIGIGDVRRIDGVRLNFRDRQLESVRGLHLTVWSPREYGDSQVRGFALGVPLTGASPMVREPCQTFVAAGFLASSFSPMDRLLWPPAKRKSPPLRGAIIAMA